MTVPDYNNTNPEDAVTMQQIMWYNTVLQPLQKDVKIIAGADISFDKGSEIVYAGIVLLKYPEMQVISFSSVITKTTFPYVPGLLGFREVPALAEVWNKLTILPDVLVLDGQGILHPRRMGIATHFGQLANIPCIGCAKSMLTGTYTQPADIPGATSDVYDKDTTLGQVLRTKRGCKPVFVSPGHLITLPESVTIIKQCIGKYRIPEPTRLAHQLVNEIRINNK